jgi:hypothetical protein
VRATPDATPHTLNRRASLIGADVVAFSEIDIDEFKVIMRAGPETEHGVVSGTLNLTKNTVVGVRGLRTPTRARHRVYRLVAR